MKLLFAAAAVLVGCVAFAIYFLSARRPEKPAQGEIRLREIGMTAYIGVFLWVLAGLMLYAKYADPALGGSDRQSYLFAGIFSMLCAAGGSYILLYARLKQIVAGPDGFVSVDLLGRSARYSWQDVTDVKVAMFTKSITLICNGRQKIPVAGDPKAIRAVCKLAYEKIGPQAGKDKLRETLFQTL